MGSESNNFEIQIIEVFCEAWSSFEKEPLHNQQLKDDIKRGIEKIKAIDQEKGEIASNFIKCLWTVNEEISMEKDPRTIAKKFHKFKCPQKEDEDNYDEVDGAQDNVWKAGNWLVSFVKKATGDGLYRKIAQGNFRGSFAELRW